MNFAYISSFNPYNIPIKCGSNFNLILKMKKLKSKKIKQFIQHHIAKQMAYSG